MTGTSRTSAVSELPREADDWRLVLELLDEVEGEEGLRSLFEEFAEHVLLTSYRDLPLDEFMQRFQRNVHAVFAGVRERRLPHPSESAEEHRETGRSRAGRGVELSDFVRVTLVAERAFAARIRERAAERGIADELIVEVLQYLDAWNTVSTAGLIAGYQEVALAKVASDQRRQDRALRQLLGGELTPVEIQQAAIDSRLDPRGRYRILRAESTGRSFNDVRRALVSTCLGATEEPAITTMYGDVLLVASHRPAGEVPFIVGVSPLVGVDELAEGFRLATRALEAARALGLAGFVGLDDLSITASAVADQEVAQILRERYLRPLEELGATGEAILDTVAEYLRRHRSVAETAQAMFVHSNTVRYRLERFETLTQCSLRHTRTLTEAWWILNLRPVGGAESLSLMERFGGSAAH